MGPLFVLMLWAVIAGVLSLLGGAVCAGIAAFLTRGVTVGRRRAIVLAAFFPVAVARWAGTIFVVLSIVNVVVLARDFGIGDTWYTPLPNGYTLAMMDEPTSADLCPTSGLDVCPQGGDLDGITRLQLAGPYMLGQAIGETGETYFLFDTRTRQRDDYASEADLAAAARRRRIALALRPVFDIYRAFRFTWVDGLAAATALGVPFLVALGGLIWLVRLQRRPNVAAD